MGNMKLPVRISNVDTRVHVDVEALVDTTRRMLIVPASLAVELNLPDYALIQHKDSISVTPLQVSDTESEVIIGLGTLTALLLEIDKRTGELRVIELMIPSVF
jgi:predicted aspartyl protease